MGIQGRVGEDVGGGLHVGKGDENHVGGHGGVGPGGEEDAAPAGGDLDFFTRARAQGFEGVGVETGGGAGF